jgi:PAS domain S-box-containing protein
MENSIADPIILRQKNIEYILHSLHEGIIAHDLQRRIFFFSRSAEELTGYTPDEVLGHDCHDVFAPRLCSDECSFCEGRPASLQFKKYSTVFIDKRGLRREFDVRTIPLTDASGSQIGVVTSLTDLTAITALQRRLEDDTEFWGIIGQDHKMQLIYDLIRDLGQSDFPVAISGESGTGKELVARAIHRESTRRDKPFVAINCGALPEGTLESELFGHVRGAFTGAIRDKRGRFEQADGGTLFLDEVAELTPAIQVKLLRVLQEGIIEPVGSEKSRTVDVRIISATNRNLKELLKNGSFREDLFYRLAVVPIDVPPLRERRNDIPLIARRCVATIAGRIGRPEVELSDDTLDVFMRFRWPGNVRELQNAIQFGLIKCRGRQILPDHLPPELLQQAPAATTHGTEANTPGRVGRKPKLAHTDVLEALTRTGGNKAKTARVLGVGRATLYNFLNEHADLAAIARSE